MQSYSRNHTYQRQGERLPVANSNKKKLVVRFGAVLVVVLVAAVGGFQLFGGKNSNNPNASKLVSPQVASASTTKEEEPKKDELQKPASISGNLPKRNINLAPLQPDLAAIIKKYPYTTSITVVDINTGNAVQAGDSYPFIAASTTKLLTVMLFMNNVEAGLDDLDNQVGTKTAKEQMQLAINKSDNEAWAALNEQLGKESLANYAKKQGLESYDVNRNTITSNDMAKLLGRFYSRQILNEEHTRLILSWMQNTSEERFIPPAIPTTNTLFHKAGYLSDRAHDVAIVDNGDAPYGIVIYSKTNTNYDFQIGQKLFKELTTRVVTTFK